MNTASIVFLAVLGSFITQTKTLRSTGSKDDVVFKDIGVKIEKIGKSISSDNEIMISIIVEFPNITRLGDVPAVLSYESMRQKIESCTDSSSLYKSAWNQNNDFFKKMASNFLSSRKALLKPFITPLNKTFEENSGRQKRGLLSFLGSLGLTLFMGGITEGQIYRLNKHIDSNRREIDLLRHGILKQQAEIENLSEHVIGFMREFAIKIQEIIEVTETCSFFFNQLLTRRRIQFVEWTKEVDDTLWTAIKGENSLLLTPRMLSLDKLHTIVRRSRAFQGTIFENDPTYLYSLAKMSLLEIEENLIFAHLVLIAPSVTEDETVDIFKVEQVGAHIGGEKCIFHDLPRFVYKKHDQSEFYPVTLDRCNKHNNLYVCPFEDFSNETACIQEKYNDCPLKRMKCPHTYQFVMSQIGILLRNNIDGQTFSSNLHGLYSSVKLSEYGTAYLYWKDLTSIQINNKKISSPKMEHIDLKMSNLSLDTDSLVHYLDSSNVTNVFKSLCDRYNKSLSEIIDPAYDTWLSSNREQWSSDWINVFILIVISIAIPGILFWVGYLHFHVYKVFEPNQDKVGDECHTSLIQLAPRRRASF